MKGLVHYPSIQRKLYLVNAQAHLILFHVVNISRVWCGDGTIILYRHGIDTQVKLDT